LAKRQLHLASAARKGVQDFQSNDDEDSIGKDRPDLDWATVLKRVMESYIRGERPNMYGEMLEW